MQHKHEHSGEVQLSVDNLTTKIKKHFHDHKTTYVSTATGIGVAGITCLIMRGRNAGVLCVPGGSDAITVRPLTFLNNHPAIVTIIDAHRQGAPSWVVRCLESGEIFSSQLQAAKEMGIPPSILSSHLNGKFDDALGFHFERIAMAA